MIMVQSTFQLVPESRDKALILMKNMVRLCRKEHGCLSYEYFEGITQPNQIVLLQEWEDAECLQAHYQTEHMEKFISRLSDLLESPVRTRSYMSPEDTAVSAGSGESPEFSESAAPSTEQTIH